MAAESSVSVEVSGLPSSFTSAQLVDHLAHLAAHVEPRDVSVQAEGVARVSFDDAQRADEAVQVVHDSVFGDNWKLTAKLVDSEASEEQQVVEKSEDKSKKRSSRTVVVSKVPSHLDMTEVMSLAKALGTVVAVKDAPDGGDKDSKSLLVTFASKDEAEQAVKEMDKASLGDSVVEAELHFVDESEEEEFSTDDDHHDESGSSSPKKGNSRQGGSTRSARSNSRGAVSNNGRRNVNPYGGNAMVIAPYLGATNGQFEGLPLRILVAADVVGAIIGKGGATIKQISQTTKARVDVNRKETLMANFAEKMVTISGPSESCSQACIEIMKVVRAEEASNSQSSNNDTSSSTQTDQLQGAPLKIVAHNNLIGRIIGKQGATIKKIMESSGAKVAVSSVNEMNSFSMERVITINGNIEALTKAEADVSGRMRAAYEYDLSNMQNSAQNLMFGGLGLPQSNGTNNAGSVGNSGSAVSTSLGMSGRNGARSNSAGNVFGNFGLQHQFQALAALNGGRSFDSAFLGGFLQPGLMPIHVGNANELAVLFVPRTAVGALIGAKGNHIKQVIKYSGASIKIAQSDSEEEDITFGNYRANETGQRRVTIVGTPDAQWRAQYLLYEKLREEFAVNGSGGNSGRRGMTSDNLVDPVDFFLTLEILVPSSQVGRVIGRGGHKVRELQKLTGANIHLPEQGSHLGEETPVHITGTFFSVQSAQRHLRAMTATRGGPGAVLREGGTQNGGVGVPE